MLAVGVWTLPVRSARRAPPPAERLPAIWIWVPMLSRDRAGGDVTLPGPKPRLRVPNPSTPWNYAEPRQQRSRSPHYSAQNLAPAERRAYSTSIYMFIVQSNVRYVQASIHHDIQASSTHAHLHCVLLCLSIYPCSPQQVSLRCQIKTRAL